MRSIESRRLFPLDRHNLREHFLQLDHDDRHMRFGAAIDSNVIDRYVARLDFTQDAMFGVAQEGDFIGVAHAAWVHHTVELALSVIEAHRRRGLGTHLFARGLAWARERGARELWMHCRSDNVAILGLARRQGMTLMRDEGECIARLDVQAGGGSIFSAPGPALACVGG